MQKDLENNKYIKRFNYSNINIVKKIWSQKYITLQ